MRTQPNDNGTVNGTCCNCRKNGRVVASNPSAKQVTCDVSGLYSRNEPVCGACLADAALILSGHYAK